MGKHSHIVIAVILMTIVMVTGCAEAQVRNGNTVQVHYTGRLEDGWVFDSSVERGPLQFQLGVGQMIPGFEKAVLGMKVGEKKTVTIPSDEAYGPRRDDMVVEVPREQLPSDITPEVGLLLETTRPDGGTIIVIITKVTDTTVTIDANHPLAGKDLIFEIELVKIL